MKNQINAIRLFLVALLIVGIHAYVHTGIDYGFQFGVNEGIKKGVSTYFLFVLLQGKDFAVDIAFNPLGYLLIIFCMKPLLQTKSKKYIKNIIGFAIIGCIVNIISIILPFFVNQYNLMQPLAICMAVEFLIFVGILYSFAIACKKQVDGYMYMEVGKDLIFATELYAFAVVVNYILQFMASVHLFFAQAGYFLTLVLVYGALFYYCVKAARYIKQLNLFQEN